jgi:hypothetical protein
VIPQRITEEEGHVPLALFFTIPSHVRHWNAELDQETGVHLHGKI